MTETRRYVPWIAPNSDASPALRAAMRDEQAALPSRQQLAAMAAKVQHALQVAPGGPLAVPVAHGLAHPIVITLGTFALFAVGLLPDSPPERPATSRPDPVAVTVQRA